MNVARVDHSSFTIGNLPFTILSSFTLMATLRISLLGPLTVTIDNHPIAFRTDAERALLTYLATRQGIPQRRDTLATLLSPDRGDSDALTYLRNRLTRLRRALHDEEAAPPWLIVDRKQITLRTGDNIVIDVTQFEQLLTTVESHAHRQLAGCPTCLTQLQAAVDLVRGEFLAGLNFPSDTWEVWLVGQREYVQQRTLDAMTLLCDAQVERGDWEAVLAVAQRQLILEPWLEAAHRALMQAQYQRGDRNAALAQYEQCAALLWEELGVEPEEETQQLRQQIIDDGLITASGVTTLNNLPMQIGRFFGRAAEKADLLQRIVDPNVRLITLVGIGGIGKTRLAIEVGQALKTSFPDGVWFVALDAIKSSPEQIKIAVGEAVGLAQDDKQLTGDQVLAILRDKQMLLILDNCETVLNELDFVPTWLNRAPDVVMLATSREPLNFGAESVIMLDGLPLGEADASAAELNAAEALFAERGRMARDDFMVTADNLPQVSEICQLVDGSPLGIVLAATWVRRRSLAQIIDSIHQSFDFLSTRLRDIDARHRSMRAVFETSWQMLDGEEQRVLAALSVFPTSFSAKAAAQVASAHLFDLDLLCEKSLLQQQHEGERYTMHSLLRYFAAVKLAARTPDIECAFVTYFSQFACAHQADYGKLQPEWPNFLVAITKAHALEAWQTVLDLVQVLDEPWFRQIRFHEMRQGLMLAIDAAAALDDQPALAHVLLRLSEVELEQNAYDTAEAHLRDVLTHFQHLDDNRKIAQVHYLLGRIKNEQAQDDEALALFDESKRLFEQEEEWLGVAKNLNLMAVCHLKTYGELETAQMYLEESIALQRQLPLTSAYVETLRNLARVNTRIGAYEAAKRSLDEAATISRQQQDRGEYAAVLFEQLLLCKKREHYQAALTCGYEALTHFEQLGSLRWEALIKTQLGLLHQINGELKRALALVTEGLRIFDELGDHYETAYSYTYLFRLYAQVGEPEQSENAKEQARKLNHKLNDPQLAARLR